MAFFFIRRPSDFTLRFLLPLDLVQGVASKPAVILHNLNLLHAAGHLDLGAVVQVTGFGALKPDLFSVFFSHGNTEKETGVRSQESGEKGAFVCLLTPGSWLLPSIIQ
ncbi:MAG TPA: hypothetical protein VF624_12265 [Tepidisphaeraceae bacterium]